MVCRIAWAVFAIVYPLCAVAAPSVSQPIGPFDNGNLAGLVLTSANSSFSFRFVADSGGLSDGETVLENISELGPYAPDSSYARLRWRAVPREKNAFSIRWSGEFEAQQAGAYSFQLEGTGGARLSIANQQVNNSWQTSGTLSSHGTVQLQRGKHPLTLDFRGDSTDAAIRLLYRYPGSAGFELVPTVALSNGQNVGLQSELFSDGELMVPLKRSIDTSIDKKWAPSVPAKVVPKEFPELTLEWSVITRTSAVGKLTLHGDEVTSAVLHVPASFLSDGSANITLAGEGKIVSKQNGEEFFLAVAGKTLGAVFSENTTSAMQLAQVSRQNTVAVSGASAVMTFQLKQNAPLYFSASAGRSETFSPWEVEQRLRLTRTRYAEDRLKSEGELAGAAEAMANLAMWSVALHPDLPVNYSDMLTLLQIGAIAPALARERALAIVAKPVSFPGFPDLIHRIYLRDTSQKDWLNQCYPHALRRYATAATSGELLGSAFCPAQFPRLGEHLLCHDARALAYMAEALGRTAESHALLQEYQRRQVALGHPTDELLPSREALASPWPVKIGGNSAPLRACEGATMPAMNWIMVDTLREANRPADSAFLAVKSALLFTGVATASARFPHAFDPATGESLGKGISPQAGMLALAAIGEFAENTTEGLRIGSLSTKESTIDNLEIDSARYKIRIGQRGIRAERNRKLLIESTHPAIFQRLRISESEATFAVNSNHAGHIRFANDHQVTSAVMDNNIQVISDENSIRCPPGKHIFRVTFAGE